MKTKQSGFTLVEIAIVLVIIGLLLGGVLKGQELISNAKIKNIVSDLNSISAAHNTYIDRYRALPGDEANAVYVARGWATVTGAGDGNGVLAMTAAATFTSPQVVLEGVGFWQTLRAAQMISGDPASAALPTNAAGGLVGVNGVATYGQPGPTVCVSGIPAKIALGVDTSIDGALVANIGNNTGTLRGANTAAAPLAPAAAVAAGAAYNETVVVPWTLCRSL